MRLFFVFVRLVLIFTVDNPVQSFSHEKEDKSN